VIEDGHEKEQLGGSEVRGDAYVIGNFSLKRIIMARPTREPKYPKKGKREKR